MRSQTGREVLTVVSALQEDLSAGSTRTVMAATIVSTVSDVITRNRKHSAVTTRGMEG